MAPTLGLQVVTSHDFKMLQAEMDAVDGATLKQRLSNEQLDE